MAKCNEPEADFVLCFRIWRHVTHSVHGLHQFPQVRLDLDIKTNVRTGYYYLFELQHVQWIKCYLIHGPYLQSQLVHHSNE